MRENSKNWQPVEVFLTDKRVRVTNFTADDVHTMCLTSFWKKTTGRGEVSSACRITFTVEVFLFVVCSYYFCENRWWCFHSRNRVVICWASSSAFVNLFSFCFILACFFVFCFFRNWNQNHPRDILLFPPPLQMAAEPIIITGARRRATTDRSRPTGKIRFLERRQVKTKELWCRKRNRSIHGGAWVTPPNKKSERSLGEGGEQSEK